MYRQVLPRGVLQVAGAAERAGWEALVLDGYSYPQLLPEYLETLEQDHLAKERGLAWPDLLGISVHGPPAVEPALELAARVRASRPDLPLLFGGQLANAAPDLLLPLLPDRSVLFSGDGDAGIAGALQEALATSGPARLIRPPGILPWQALPALDLLEPSFGTYLADEHFEYHLESQIGCPYRCFHCGTGRKGLYARTRNRPIEDIQSELDTLVSWASQLDHPLPRLWVTDETFASDEEQALTFCEALASRAELWRWRAQTRADVVSERLVKAMRAAGCDRLAFGVEIPNDEGLDLLGKREGMKAVEQAFALCRENGISPEAIVVVGAPGDPTRPEEFLDALDHLGAGSVQPYIYHPIPGSPWWRKHGASFRKSSGAMQRWADLDFHSPPLDASPEETERAIVAFLALNLWQPTEARESPPGQPTEDTLLTSPLCIHASTAVQVFLHKASRIAICRLIDDWKTCYIARSGSRVDLLEIKPADRGNLYAKIRSVISQQRIEAASCPLCLGVYAQLPDDRHPSPAS